jgi:hypothetical protein
MNPQWLVVGLFVITSAGFIYGVHWLYKWRIFRHDK